MVPIFQPPQKTKPIKMLISKIFLFLFIQIPSINFGHLPKGQTEVIVTNSTGQILENVLRTLTGNPKNHIQAPVAPIV